MSQPTWEQTAMLRQIRRERLARIGAEIERLKAEREDIVTWLASNPEQEMCGDCHRPVAEHANFCPQFRWPS